jgi:predicted acylesterase/phospholipase RssA/CRP-like cAMP-binding protein
MAAWNIFNVQGVTSDHRNEIRQFLTSTDFFRGLDDETFASVEAELEWISIKTGDVLMRQGELGDSLMVLLSGRLRAYIERENGVESPLGEICPGEVVGEMSLIADDRRSATVRAIRPSTLVRLTRTGFNRLHADHPHIMKQIAELVVRRLRSVTAKGKPRSAKLTIGIIGATPEAPLQSFAAALAKALSLTDTTFHVSTSVVDAHVGAGFSATADATKAFRLTTWLTEQERRHRFVIYEADSLSSPWTRRVIEQSDRILVLAPGGNAPDADVSQKLMSVGYELSSARKDVVLVHQGAKVSPSGTAAWLDAIPCEDRYHVSMQSLRDFERLARIVAGQATGLVLGGGGARGFAHIGVIRALRDANVTIDFVGGTSIGALIAAQFALNWEFGKMIEQNRKLFRTYPIHGDYALLGATTTPPHDASRLYESLLGEALIEDQPLNFFSVACNLTRGELVVGKRGRLWERVAASSALPVLNAPLFHKGDVLVDGAVINNLPADIMKDVCGGKVIAVDVSPRSDLSASTNEFRRLVRSGKQPHGHLPSIQSVVMRTVMLNSLLAADSMRQHCDLYLKPPVEDIEMFDWTAVSEAADIGYRYASQQLRSLAL